MNSVYNVSAPICTSGRVGVVLEFFLGGVVMITGVVKWEDREKFGSVDAMKKSSNDGGSGDLVDGCSGKDEPVDVMVSVGKDCVHQTEKVEVKGKQLES